MSRQAQEVGSEECVSNTLKQPELPSIESNEALPEVLPEASPETPQDSLQAVARELENCQRCKLSKQGRNQIVIGEGNSKADLVFVGEAPGEQEDQTGKPFVGKAGQLLTKMIEAMGLKREDVFICNVVKCRPPDNRNPEPDEIESCNPYLKRQLALIQPKVIVALGKFAAQTLLQTDTGITRLRGKFYEYEGVKLLPSFHPSYLLRNPSAKREAWSDLQMAAVQMGIQIPSRGSKK